MTATKQKRSGARRAVLASTTETRPSEATLPAPPASPLPCPTRVAVRPALGENPFADVPCPYGFDAPRQTLHAPHELCEFCALSLTDARSAFETENVGTLAKPATIRTTRKLPVTTLKPKGEPCPRCGRNDPPGSHPWRWDVRARFGDGHDGQVYQYVTTKGEA